jgi:hypothetical protein
MSNPTQQPHPALLVFTGTAFVYAMIMRCLAVILAAVLLTGCAARAKTSQRVEAQPEPQLAADRYEPAEASALAFDPPIVASALTPSLAREGRGEAAYVGFDEVITTRFYLRYDDRQVIQSRGPERYERRAISERFGVSYR